MEEWAVSDEYGAQIDHDRSCRRALAMSSSLRETWEETSSNPDPVTDLGYEHEPLTAVHVEEDGEQYIFLPGEEDHLSDAEFIIADPDSVQSLGDRR